ncbi:MAG: hypothetical protein ACRC37_00160, partial [Lentisphaeria bacterium]
MDFSKFTKNGKFYLSATLLASTLHLAADFRTDALGNVAGEFFSSKNSILVAVNGGALTSKSD